jgi:protein-S-isoprenylcysteine O-methyltransferase Ste14
VLAIYLISAFILLVTSFIIFRFIVRRDYMRKGRLTLISTILETLIWAPYFCFPYIYNPSSWPDFLLPDRDVSPLLKYVGIISIIAGFALVLITMASLGFRKSFGQKVKGLKQTGFYALTRNPQIVGSLPMIIGIALRWPSWHALGWVFLGMAMFHMMVLTEEKHLRNVFGKEYVQYCKRVPRYIGIPRRVNAERYH